MMFRGTNGRCMENGETTVQRKGSTGVWREEWQVHGELMQYCAE